ncbi:MULTISPECIES: ATP-binding protein [unclassified Hydrogenophaga]|uniref:ATP-binding protein n=1 Tax=unclassified Hydrogenophaga TaxID=2610897 RepID=UPI0008783F2A|nr:MULTISPECIES: ATP-binding protein [unclassified Hydrogenophaga]MBN9369590.1 response regulator [Hydrogenophaga sp.]OJV69741.1 MAG: hybrid sensor histidine kinase/response regulator [Hydrogenophaga sp. 70-12]
MNASPADPAAAAPDAPQRIIKVRRDYNSWVGSETLEDYALRYTPQRFRKWSEWRVANTAFGVASFLVLEAVGATLLLSVGFTNAALAILATGLIIFLAGLPISVYAARHGVDMDLLTRGAGFGYIGSTITSLIYASFTFIFFALEAAVMAYALELALDIPPAWGYLICALVVIPLVTHGVSAISRFQMWTQPLWLVMMVVPFVAVAVHAPATFREVVHYAGASGTAMGFDWHLFGAALTVGIALITQMGEQADYLRFMPARQPGRGLRWWAGVIAGGPGWVLIGVLKMLGGALLAYLAIRHSVPAERAVDPNQMYLAAYDFLLPHGWAVAATALFVVVSQLKINVTNAYAGSLAWSNFFSRLTHSHPGRVVWVVFNTFIAFLLMEMNVFQALGQVLGVYANIAIAWIMAVVADLIVNKPLGLSPPGIEFKRAHLYDINPVGVGAMALASVVSITAHLGVMGPTAEAFSAVIAMVTAFLAAPAIAWLTRGRFYLARPSGPQTPQSRRRQAAGVAPIQVGGASAAAGGVCVICEQVYEGPDMAHCPAYQGPICSLCCTLDARCGDLCKPHARLSVQWNGALRRLLPRRAWPYLDAGLAHYLLLMLIVAPLLAAVLGLLYRQEVQSLAATLGGGSASLLDTALRSGFLRVYAVLLLIAATVAWWLVLAHKSREVAQEESNRQTHLLMREIESHRRTDEALQQARHAAEQANQAKTRYISTISHELRTPLNSILGYAQLLQEDSGLAPHRAQAIRVIHRGGEHLLSLIEGTLDIARIEAGKFALDVKPMAFAATLAEVAGLFELQAAAKGLRFVYDTDGRLPEAVRADDKRVRQILINLLGNAVKFTQTGEVRLRVRHAREMAHFEVHDTGPGMGSADVERVFEPFARGAGEAGERSGVVGTGLGLTIAKMLTDLMGGELSVRSAPGQGSVFTVRLFLPEMRGALPVRERLELPAGYEGERCRVLVVDNEEADRELLQRWLEPLGFEVQLARSGDHALELLAGLRPGEARAPHAVFLDLAMPGIDGWETRRRLRAAGWAGVPLAIVSANAFDKGLHSELGPGEALAPQDFFVKPVRRSELLAWLAQRLNLRWTEAAAAPEPPPLARPEAALPAREEIAPLLELVRLGYTRGILQWLDDWVRRRPERAGQAAALATLAREFRFEAIERQLGQDRV